MAWVKNSWKIRIWWSKLFSVPILQEEMDINRSIHSTSRTWWPLHETKRKPEFVESKILLTLPRELQNFRNPRKICPLLTKVRTVLEYNSLGQVNYKRRLTKIGTVLIQTRCYIFVSLNFPYTILDGSGSCKTLRHSSMTQVFWVTQRRNTQKPLLPRRDELPRERHGRP